MQQAYQTVKKIEEMGWALLQHFPYSLYSAPSNMHMFGPQSESLGDIRESTQPSTLRGTVK